MFDVALDVRPVGADKPPENDLDRPAVGDQLVGLSVTLEAHELRGRVPDQLGHLLLLDPVSRAEPVQYGDPLGGELPHRAFHGVDLLVLAVCRLDKSRLEEPLADGPGHVFRHGECGRGRGRDDPRGILRVRHAIGLRELEGAEVVDRIFGEESVLDLGQSDPVRGQRKQADDQRCKRSLKS